MYSFLPITNNCQSILLEKNKAHLRPAVMSSGGGPFLVEALDPSGFTLNPALTPSITFWKYTFITITPPKFNVTKQYNVTSLTFWIVNQYGYAFRTASMKCWSKIRLLLKISTVSTISLFGNVFLANRQEKENARLNLQQRRHVPHSPHLNNVLYCCRQQLTQHMIALDCRQTNTNSFRFCSHRNQTETTYCKWNC